MIRLATITFVLLSSLANTSFSQCLFDSNDSDKTFAEVATCLADCGCQSINISASVTIGEDWGLTSHGNITLTIEDGGSLVFTGSGQNIGEINMTSGSILIVEDTNDDNALTASGNQGQVRIAIGSAEFKGNQFDDIILVGGVNGNGPLPVELLSFDVKTYKNSIEIFWQTATELNNDYFTIERSKDGLHYQGIGTVQGVGTSKQEQSYQFTDARPYEGTSYYRLKQTDFDGTSETFRPVSIFFEETASPLSVFPNPSIANKVFISAELNPVENTEILIYNLHGQVVLNQKIDTDDKGYREFELDVSHLPAGKYLISLSGDHNFYMTKLLVK